MSHRQAPNTTPLQPALWITRPHTRPQLSIGQRSH